MTENKGSSQPKKNNSKTGGSPTEKRIGMLRERSSRSLAL